MCLRRGSEIERALHRRKEEGNGRIRLEEEDEDEAEGVGTVKDDQVKLIQTGSKEVVDRATDMEIDEDVIASWRIGKS